MSFNNYGTYRLDESAGATTTFPSGSAFNQAGGVLNVNSNYLDLQGGGNFTGGLVTNAAGLVESDSGVTLNGTVTSTSVQLTSNGSLVGTNVIYGVFIWQTGKWNAASVTIATNGLLWITGAATHNMLGTTVTNLGTVIWTNAFLVGGVNGSQTTIDNYGLSDCQGDLTLNGNGQNGGGTTVFNNAGTFRKSAGTSSTIFQYVPFNNTGNLDAQTGVIALTAGGNFTGGSATNLNGLVQLSGASFTLNGTITSTNFQLLNGGSLTGTILFTNGFNWVGGNLNGAASVTIAPNSLLWITSANNHNMVSTTLTNLGTVAWANGLIVGGGSQTIIDNYGLWDCQDDLTLNGNNENSGGTTIFNNAGTFRKSAGTGNTVVQYPVFNNTGNLDAQTGVIVLDGGGNFTGGTVTNLNGVVKLENYSYNVNGTVTTTNFQLVSGNLTGYNVITNGFTWVGGNWNGASVTIAPNALLLMPSAVNYTMWSATVTNLGTVIWGNGLIVGGSGRTMIYNYGLWDCQSNLTLNGNSQNGGGTTAFNNAGTFRKSAGASSMVFQVTSVTNTGILDAQSGVIALQNGGSFTGGTLNFGLSSAAAYGQISFSGAMPRAGTVSANFKNGFIPTNGNSFAVISYGSKSGSFANTLLPLGFTWTTNYGSTSYTMSVASVLPSGSVTNLTSQWQSGQAALQFGGTPNASYTILAMTNLTVPRTNWIPLGQAMQPTSGSFQYLDGQSSAYPQRFYQIRSP